MFIIFPLSKTQAWVLMALILLCFSVCPHSSYPHAPEDEDPTDGEANEENNEENQQWASNEGNDMEEEETEEAAEDVENDTPKPCLPRGAVCTNTDECCKNTLKEWSVECRLSAIAKYYENDPTRCLNNPYVGKKENS